MERLHINPGYVNQEANSSFEPSVRMRTSSSVRKSVASGRTSRFPPVRYVICTITTLAVYNTSVFSQN
jgi:hypothetical protein